MEAQRTVAVSSGTEEARAVGLLVVTKMQMVVNSLMAWSGTTREAQPGLICTVASCGTCSEKSYLRR